MRKKGELSSKSHNGWTDERGPVNRVAGSRSIDLSAKAPDGRLSNRAECRCFASGREAHSSAATTFGRASPSAVAEQANSALEPTALRAAVQRPESLAGFLELLDAE